jgi:hypothetical protein
MPTKTELVYSLIVAAFVIGLTGVGLILLLTIPWKSAENKRRQNKN